MVRTQKQKKKSELFSSSFFALFLSIVPQLKSTVERKLCKKFLVCFLKKQKEKLLLHNNDNNSVVLYTHTHHTDDSLRGAQPSTQLEKKFLVLFLFTSVCVNLRKNIFNLLFYGKFLKEILSVLCIFFFIEQRGGDQVQHRQKRPTDDEKTFSPAPYSTKKENIEAFLFVTRTSKDKRRNKKEKAERTERKEKTSDKKKSDEQTPALQLPTKVDLILDSGASEFMFSNIKVAK